MKIRDRIRMAYNILVKPEQVREELAKLEHQQWESWTTYCVENYDIPEKVEKKWQENWNLYELLPEEERDKDRKWADKALKRILKA